MAARRVASQLLTRALAQSSRTTAVAAESSLLRCLPAAGAAHAVSSSRSLFTSSPALSFGLVKTLKEEISYETKEYKKPKELASGPPAPFTLSETPGDTVITLKRTFGAEEIAIDLNVNTQPNEEAENDDGESLSTVIFNVSVTKGDETLLFECESDGTYVSIAHVSIEPKGGFTDPEGAYHGPVFDELDENVQREFRLFLEERGVSEEVGEYLRHLVFDKEQREYMSWLEKVAKFTEKK